MRMGFESLPKKNTEHARAESEIIPAPSPEATDPKAFLAQAREKLREISDNAKKEETQESS